jgi:hypothetical protein
MNTRQIILAGMIIIALLSVTGTVAAQGNSSAPAHSPDTGSIGPGSPMFGLKVAMENLDETFTINDTRRVEKQVDHAQARIEEVQQELELNQSVYAGQALDLYQEKLNQTEDSLLRFPSDAPGLLHTEELIARNQEVLANLLSRYPSNAGLARAFRNSQALGQKFGEKTRGKTNSVTGKDTTSALKTGKTETGKQNNGRGNITANASTSKGKNESQVRVKDKQDEIPVSPTITIVHTIPGNDKGSSVDQGKNSRN